MRAKPTVEVTMFEAKIKLNEWTGYGAVHGSLIGPTVAQVSILCRDGVFAHTS